MTILDVGALIGLTMTSVEQAGGDELVFTTDDGRVFKLYHAQDCCESVVIEDVVGELSDLVGAPILQAEEASSDGPPKSYDYGYGISVDESYTWTFYKFATVKGYVTVRWYGTSNGYYSESVDFAQS